MEQIALANGEQKTLAGDLDVVRLGYGGWLYNSFPSKTSNSQML